MSDSVVTKTSESLTFWLEAAASKRPTPGGGSAAAVAGALAAAMGEMTLNFSAGRKANDAGDEAVIADCLRELSAARGLLLRLSEEDQAAYAAWRETKELPEDDPKRRAAVAAAITVPQAVAAACLSVLDLAVRAAPSANPWLLGDLRVCGDLATAAVRCAGYNVLANLPPDAAEEREQVVDQTRRAVERVNALTAAADARASP